MELPITEKELEKILSTIKNIDYHLYAKLWSYKIKMKNEKEIQ
jgi:hypothetical protein